MGIDAHAFNFIKLQSLRRPLGRVLTIGRQSMSVSPAFVCENLTAEIKSSEYCEPLLWALGAKGVDSLDYSDYERATRIADLNQPISLSEHFDTIIDSGSVEHIFDVATVFRNLIGLCSIGGQIIHFLPVNNLNGHGFWQFSSDLLYTIYSERNGFFETEVFYASSLDPATWYKMPEPQPGVRVEIVSLEPIILLSVTRKAADVETVTVTQPFYAPAWASKDASNIVAPSKAIDLKNWLQRSVRRDQRLAIVLRNLHLIIGLMTGTSRYSLSSQCARKITVEMALRELST